MRSGVVAVWVLLAACGDAVRERPEVEEIADTEEAPEVGDTGQDSREVDEAEVVDASDVVDGIDVLDDVSEDEEVSEVEETPDTQETETEVLARRPRPGEVIFQELMIHPATSSPWLDEWIEIASLGTEIVNLLGCVLRDDGSDRVFFGQPGGLEIEPGEIVVLGHSTMLLEDISDEVILECDGEVVDAVRWSAYAWPVITGLSLQLDPTRRNADDNDEVESWCTGTGTRGLPNVPCPHLDNGLEGCELLPPFERVGYRNSPTTFGVSISGGEFNPQLVVEVRVGDESFLALSGAEGAFLAEVVKKELGRFEVAARASSDGGVTWLECGAVGQLEVVETPCVENACKTPPAASCSEDGVAVLGYGAEGRCVPTSSVAYSCEYEPVVTHCGVLGRACEDTPTGAGCERIPRGPDAGEVVISELVFESETTQWVEVTSTVDEPLNLTGCTLFGDTPTVIGRYGRVVVGATLETEGNLRLECGEVLIDEVVWDEDFPVTEGASMSLSPFHIDAGDNDLAESWCVDRGSLGEENATCPGDLLPVDSCALLPPLSVNPPAGTTLEVVAKVIARTYTGRSSLTDVSPRVRLEVGYGDGWTSAVPDLTWSTAGQGVDPAEDRYRGTLRVPAQNARVILRASADGGNSWTSCGDGVAVSPVPSACEPDPCATPPGPICREVASGSPTLVIGQGGPATCSLEGGAARCAFVETQLEDCAKVGAVCADGACVGHPRRPVAGELTISELMIAPLQGGNANELGEWVEIQSNSDDSLDLTGCELRSGGPNGVESWVVPVPATPLSHVLKAREALTFARSGAVNVNGGVSPAAVWLGIALGNGEDWLAVVCGEELDRVSWASPEWTVKPGKSLQLSGVYLENQDNDISSHWCVPGASTPKVRNLACPVDGVVESCVLTVGEVLEAEADEAVSVSMLIRDDGVTDLRPVTDRAYAMEVEVGFGPDGEDPRWSNRWTWAELGPDEGWEDPSFGEDRWAGLMVGKSVGDYRVLGRVSLDGGRRWELCGLDGLNGEAAHFEVRPGPCAPNPCLSPPAATCSGTMLKAYASTGVCQVVNGAASCTYPSENFECALFSGCSPFAGTCVAPPTRPTTAGDLIVSEVMRDSSLPPPDKGEWVEFHNPGAQTFDLRGCELVDEAGRRVVIAAPVPVLGMPGGHRVFAQSTVSAENGGIPTAHGVIRSLGLTLANGAGSIALECDGVVIDKVAWSWDSPGGTGVAMQRDRLSFGISAGIEAWCEATVAYGPASSNGANKGSPATLNLACP